MPDRLIDSFGRVHDNLRISVTDRCNIRCFYCMPERRAVRAAREILDFEEIERFVRVCRDLGVDKLRVTGGEPLVRQNLPGLIESWSAIPAIQDLALTTNGVLLAAAGARRSTTPVCAGSTSTSIRFDRERFEQITPPRRSRSCAGRDRIVPCAGFDQIKINAVAVKGVTSRYRSAGALRPRARFRDPLHRVHAARCAALGLEVGCCWRTT